MEDGDLRWCCGSSSNDDWDLHAVVRSATCSCSGGGRGVATSPRASEESLFSGSGVPLPPLQSQHDDVTDAAALQQLPIGGGPAVDDDFWANDRSVAQPRNQEAQPPPQLPAPKPRTSYRNNDGGPTRSKRKKKKSQVSNKEVTRVPVGASSPPDPWAWRKYGQKPIKGSPYPRGYYRCSTDKSCRARKQVERCRTDPSTLIVSYAGGEHSHPVPLHRSALAGTTRNKPQRLPASSSSTSPAEQQTPAAASSSPPIDTSTPPLLLCPSTVGGEYSSASLLLEDADMEGEEDVLSFLKPTPPSPTDDGSGSKDVTQLRQLPLPGTTTTSSRRTADGSWAAAPAAMNVTHEIKMCPF